ncbi:MAG: DUF2206 domain-containing protein [Halobacteriaceae archaeon]
MATGSVINFVFPLVGIANPISIGPLSFGIAIGILSLLATYYYRGDSLSVTVPIDHLWYPWPLFLLLLPLVAILGARLITRTGNNSVILLLLAVIAALPAAVCRNWLPSRLLPFAVWSIAIALLLHNTLIGNFLAWGDQPKEAFLAGRVLAEGFWNPVRAPHASKNAMLRIVLLHPLYSLFTGINLIWEFKIIHPLLFSFTPVALYQTYKRYVADRGAFLVTYLFMSLFSFFIVLSRNTRTSTAIFFLALLILVVSDRETDRISKKWLSLIFGFSIIVSHYGTSYIILLSLVLVSGILLLRDWFLTDSQSPITTVAFGLFYITLAFAWYIYVSAQSTTFNAFISFGEHFFITLRNQFIGTPQSSTTVKYVATQFHSITLQALKYLNIVIGITAMIGLISAVLRRFQDVRGSASELPFDDEYLVFGLIFFGLFGITFLPIARFNTARTLAITMVVFLPFVYWGIAKLVSWLINIHQVGTQKTVTVPSLNQIIPSQSKFPLILGTAPQLRTGHDTSVNYKYALGVLTAIAMLYFIFNSGLFAASVTHGYAPNELIEKDRVMTMGSEAEKRYFYNQYKTEYSVSSSRWLLKEITPGTTVYGRRPVTTTYKTEIKKSKVNIYLGMPGNDTKSGFLYLSSRSYISGIYPGERGSRLPIRKSGKDSTSLLFQKSGFSKVYVNGGSVVYYQSNPQSVN